MKSRTVKSIEPLKQAPASIDVSQLQSLFDLVPDVVFFVKDQDGRYVAVNDSLIIRHGLKGRAEALGKQPCEICPGDFGLIPTRQDMKVLKSGVPLIEHLEMQWHRPNDPVWCLTTKLPVRDADKKIIGLIGFSRDIRAHIDPPDIPVDFARVLEEFEQDLISEMTPTLLAKRSRMSLQRLARLTKRFFDLTPTQFITKTRLTAATRLLNETDHSISEIAHSCGFYDHSAFTRAFRSATGVPPSVYRSES